MTIRAARLGDARAIAEVHVASWRWAYEGRLTSATLDALSVDERETMWSRALADPEPGQGCFVAEEAGRIVGFAGFGAFKDDPTIRGGPVGAKQDEHVGELYALYLLRDAQGSGVGRALLEVAQRELLAAGFERATLWVLEDNDLARRFYERAGWKWDGTTSEHRFDCGNQPITRYVTDL